MGSVGGEMSNDRAQASHTPIAMEPGVKQLFLDDYVVAETADLERTLHRPERRGPVIKPDRSWSGG